MNKDNYVLITGATGGIGSSIIVKAISNHIPIIAIARNEEKAEKLRAILSFDKRSFVLVADLKNDDDLVKIFNETKSRECLVSWLILASGIAEENERTGQSPENHIKNYFQVNTIAPIKLSELFKNYLEPDGGIIFIGSTAGISGNSDFPIYSATKGALHIYALSLAKKWAKITRKSIIVAPGRTNTAMRQRIMGDASTAQSPNKVSDVVVNIITGEFQTSNGDTITVREGRASIVGMLNL